MSTGAFEDRHCASGDHDRFSSSPRRSAHLEAENAYTDRARRQAGRMMKKMNTFTDFIDVAAYLEKNRYTSADRVDRPAACSWDARLTP